jgi:hypothetical protein
VKLGLAKKVVIITEAILEEKITRLLCSQGVKDYTVYHELTSKGRQGIRSGGIGILDKIYTNICIEVIVEQEEMALSIIEIISKKFLNGGRAYSGIVYLEDVRVISPEIHIETDKMISDLKYYQG